MTNRSQTQAESTNSNKNDRASKRSFWIHWLAAAALTAAILLTAVLFVLLTPFDPLTPGVRQRDDDAVLVIRTFAFGAISLGFLSAALAATGRSFGSRPRSSSAIICCSAVVTLAAVYRIFQTIGI